MAKHLFSYDNYRELLIDSIATRDERGFKTRLAEAAGCQLSYFSQVLHGSVHLTEDQAYGVTIHLSLNEIESEFFVLLVRMERAGSKGLRNHLVAKIKQIQSDQKKLSKRLKTKKIAFEHQEQYYAAWYYSAIHMCLSIPEMQNKQSLLQYLLLDDDQLAKAIDLLLTMGLVEKSNKYFKTIEYNIHVPSNTPLHVSYNLVWRSFFSQRLQSNLENDIHYTAVHSLSRSDSQVLREMIMKFIEESREVVSLSDEETLVAITVDFCQPIP